MGSIVPYTYNVLMPLNKQLLQADASAHSSEWKRSRLEEWGRLHGARTAAALAAFSLMLYELSRRRQSS